MSRAVDDGEGRKVFVGGITFGVESQHINEDFGKYGEIEDVYLPTDRETGKLRGFGFVTFKDAKDAQDASAAMHGRERYDYDPPLGRYEDRSTRYDERRSYDERPRYDDPRRDEPPRRQYDYGPPRERERDEGPPRHGERHGYDEPPRGGGYDARYS